MQEIQDGPTRRPEPVAARAWSSGPWLGAWLAVELVLVGFVAVFPVGGLVMLVGRTAEDLVAGRGLGRLGRRDPIDWLMTVAVPFSLAVLVHVIVARWRRVFRSWSTTERVLLAVGQALGYSLATVLFVAMLCSAPPLALFPLAPWLIGMDQIDYIRARWRLPRGGRGTHGAAAPPVAPPATPPPATPATPWRRCGGPVAGPGRPSSPGPAASDRR